MKTPEIKKATDWISGQDEGQYVKNEQGQYMYYSHDKSHGINLPYILADYYEDQSSSQIEDLTKEVERLRNDLLDALDLKQGKGPTALSMLKSENDRYREALEDVINCCNAAGGPDEKFMDTIILDIRKRASAALHPLVKEGENK